MEGGEIGRATPQFPGLVGHRAFSVDVDFISHQKDGGNGSWWAGVLIGEEKSFGGFALFQVVDEEFQTVHLAETGLVRDGVQNDEGVGPVDLILQINVTLLLPNKVEKNIGKCFFKTKEKFKQ